MTPWSPITPWYIREGGKVRLVLTGPERTRKEASQHLGRRQRAVDARRGGLAPGGGGTDRSGGSDTPQTGHVVSPNCRSAGRRASRSSQSSKVRPNQSVALDRAGMTVARDITFLADGPAGERSRSATEESGRGRPHYTLSSSRWDCGCPDLPAFLDRGLAARIRLRDTRLPIQGDLSLA